MSSSATPNRSRRGSDSRCTSSAGAVSALAAPVGGATAAGAAPSIISDKLCAVSSAGTTTPVTRPPRSTVARVHSARTSSSLWLM